MNLFVSQTIVIQQIRVDGIQNSSVLQIGSAGVIQPISQLFNTGGFTGPAPQIPDPDTAPSVPLGPPS
ncbi:MAG: spore germination protein GerPB [Bacillota bacterium]|jgi:spore germination protein PB|uniref:Spore gernimation protein KA n=3 Tax=Fictibacillus TaxID=1329200 RepID=A0A160IID0_9BACL|nr:MULTISPECIES: spore germination protein GerPB [Bacillaceae]ANC75733.1 spore gernimation protein KA [Fictibacillus phosphorivorans]MBH0171356.1 spore gernimation protein KA [Fictibacillus sp. 18YEL24]MBN3553239.1 spore gernimation protein KA [Fictibacillus nanhaiensis]MQR96095.1 spore gernimation protein KA [Fictibacillus phosphorivorans]